MQKFKIARFVKNTVTGVEGGALLVDNLLFDAALLVIDPTISQAGAVAWTIGGFVAGFFIAQMKGE